MRKIFGIDYNTHRNGVVEVTITRVIFCISFSIDFIGFADTYDRTSLEDCFSVAVRKCHLLNIIANRNLPRRKV